MPWESLPGSKNRGPARIDEPLDRLVRSLGAPSASSVRDVFSIWNEIVGDQIAAHAEPGSLHDGVLRVLVDDPTWITQLRFMETELLEKLGVQLGEDAPGRIELRVRRA